MALLISMQRNLIRILEIKRRHGTKQIDVQGRIEFFTPIRVTR